MKRAFLVVLSLCVGASAWAQSPAGTVAALQGRADAQAAGQPAWRPLALKNDVFVGERIRTADASRLKLLMRDDSVLTLGPRSELTIDQQVVKGDGGAATDTSRLGALVGSVRAVVTDRYGSRGSSFEVKTPTAVAGVRGTGFVVLVDADGKRTRVIGLYHTTWVRSVADSRGRHEVRIGPGQITEIVAGGEPTKPRQLSRDEQDSLAGETTMAGGPGTQPAAATETTPPEGSGDQGDPATPGPPMGLPSQRPDSAIDQPLNRLPGPKEPPPPPPR